MASLYIIEMSVNVADITYLNKPMGWIRIQQYIILNWTDPDPQRALNVTVYVKNETINYNYTLYCI